MNIIPITNFYELGPRWFWFFLFIWLCLYPACLRADYAIDKYTGSVVNGSPESAQYRVTLFDAVTTGGTPTGDRFIAAGNRSFSTSSTSHRAIQAQIRNSVNTVLWTSSIIYTNPSNAIPGTAGTVGAYNVAYPYIHNSDTGSWYFDIRIWNSAISSWGSYVSQTPIFTTSTEYTPTATVKGGIIHSWEFTAGAFSKTALNLSHDGPFFVVVEKLVTKLTPDGGQAGAWEPEDEYTSTEVTVVDTASTPPAQDPDVMVDAPEVKTTTFEDLPPAARPTTVDSFATLNEADEARFSDSKGLLGQIRDAIGQVKDGIAGLGAAGKGDYKPTDTEEEAASETTNQGRISALMGRIDDLRESFNGIGAVTDLSPPSGSPQFRLDLNLKGQDFSWTSPPVMDTAMAIVRALLGVYISYSSIISGINIARGAFADNPS